MSKQFDESLYRFCKMVYEHISTGKPCLDMASELCIMHEQICKSKAFTPPTPEEARIYAKNIGFELDGEKFCAFYQCKGWMVGKSKMKDWKAAVRTWKPRKPDNPESEFERMQREYNESC